MKWFGKIGFSTSEKDLYDPFKTINKITERDYYGDLLQISKKDQSNATINDNYTIGNQISILADPFAYENFSSIRYATLMNSKWKISTVMVQYPRITLTLGELYSEEENVYDG